jgi:hypothetical protein
MRRVEMEDHHVAIFPNYADDVGGVDGHSGKSSVEFDAENMPKFMAEEMDHDQMEWTVHT